MDETIVLATYLRQLRWSCPSSRKAFSPRICLELLFCLTRQMNAYGQYAMLARLAENPPKIEGGRVALQPTEGGKTQLRITSWAIARSICAPLSLRFHSRRGWGASSMPTKTSKAVIVERISPGLDQAARAMRLATSISTVTAG